MRVIVRKSLMGFAAVVGIIFIIALLFSRVRESTQDTELANAATRIVAERLRKAVTMARARGETVLTCHDFACEQFIRGFKSPEQMTVEVDSQPDGVKLTVRHELGTIEASWDSRKGGEIEETELLDEE